MEEFVDTNSSGSAARECDVESSDGKADPPVSLLSLHRDICDLKEAVLQLQLRPCGTVDLAALKDEFKSFQCDVRCSLEAMSLEISQRVRGLEESLTNAWKQEQRSFVADAWRLQQQLAESLGDRLRSDINRSAHHAVVQHQQLVGALHTNAEPTEMLRTFPASEKGWAAGVPSSEANAEGMSDPLECHPTPPLYRGSPPQSYKSERNTLQGTQSSFERELLMKRLNQRSSRIDQMLGTSSVRIFSGELLPLKLQQDPG
eukprot:NODE_589_length_2070_cov_28.892627_g543_i0.p1 GENE.NODE_589_length_2070_cov_28.892627_g543_i0~~NODE_589_length_2070_cov_28.892627_g543_i0.p1  ORF type:complete len:259 (+),score=51.32 NODE_589_length_2070_cov_28.892627_g543_i0:1150-1926(+)